jgi:hypothetical protein
LSIDASLVSDVIAFGSSSSEKARMTPQWPRNLLQQPANTGTRDGGVWPGKQASGFEAAKKKKRNNGKSQF